MKNKFRLLGLLGLLGFLGILTKNYGFFGFFGFFSFFGAKAKNDERLLYNKYKAGFLSFIVGLIGLSAIIVGLSLKTGISVIALITAAAFIAMLITFLISFLILDRKGT